VQVVKVAGKLPQFRDIHSMQQFCAFAGPAIVADAPVVVTAALDYLSTYTTSQPSDPGP